MPAKPEWLKVKIPSGEKYLAIMRLKQGLELHTVCEEAKCPNIYECWGGGTATFMVLGDTCTRHCRFCAVRSGRPNGYLDPLEPAKLAYAIRRMNLTYVVVTSVDRDDLEDGGSSHFAACIREIRRLNPSTYVEVLIPDFRGDVEAVRRVVEAGPHVVAHNIETVRRLTPVVRDPRASYEQSLSVLRAVKEFSQRVYTKSSIMVGLGETREEVVEAMKDLRSVGVDFLTIGQYLQPTKANLPVKEYIHPSVFEEYRVLGEQLGFKYVASGPLVRSSYRAGEYFIESMLRKQEAAAGGR